MVTHTFYKVIYSITKRRNKKIRDEKKEVYKLHFGKKWRVLYFSKPKSVPGHRVAAKM
tara:strand:+ start:324 stop:497 length:174 start_codon:yes stop_codon:yes gene_type:complete